MEKMNASAHKDEYDHPVPEVMYIASNIPGPGTDPDDFNSEYTVGCLCVVNCTNCLCTRGSPNYVNGRILADKMAGPIFECHEHCACSRDCGNRIVQQGPLDSLIVLAVGGKGYGLLTTKFINKGQFICEYAGEVIGIDEARRRVEDNKTNNSMNYVLVVSEYSGPKKIVTCVDPKYFGNIGRYANHSCTPNSVLVPVRIEGIVPRLCLFAIRDIDRGEEVTFNYAGEVANSVHSLSETPCICGSNNCSGYLPHDPI